ncbi:MAG: VWA domain-containing protein [Kiritimatiellia bacterium]
MNLVFLYPGVLLLIWVAPLLAAWWFVLSRRREKRLDEFVSAPMRRKLSPANALWRSRWQVTLVTLAIVLAVLAAARPQWGVREERIVTRSRDLIIALDVSRSMLANDVYPNRLQRAKADILDLIDELRGDRAGLLAFRYKAVLLCPLTTDYAFLKYVVDSLDVDSAPAGETDIADALRKAMEAFGENESSHKAIVLISDGEDLLGNALTVAEDLGKKNIPVFAVGLGNREGARIPLDSSSSGYLQFKGEDVITRLDDDTLYAIARKTGGTYVPVGVAGMTTTTLGTLYREHLRRIAAREQEETLQQRHVERYQIFLLPALLMFMTAAYFSRGRLTFRTQPRSLVTAPSVYPNKGPFITGPAYGPRPAPATNAKRGKTKPVGSGVRLSESLSAAAIILVLTLTAQAATTNQAGFATNTTELGQSDKVQAVKGLPRGAQAAWQARSLHALGRHKEAAQLYLEAAKSATGKSQRDYRYNAAIALYKAGQYRECTDILRELFHEAPTPSLEEVASALGASLYREAEQLSGNQEASALRERARLLREAAEAFKMATRLKSDDALQQRNLALVLNKLPEAEKQARIAELMARYGQKSPGELVNQMLLNQRRINDEARAAFTNDSPTQITRLEALSRQQKENAELWIPLKSKLLAALAQQPDLATNQSYIARMENVIEALRDRMLEHADSLRDLDSSAYPAARQAEQGLYQIWKSVALYPLILEEAIRRQTNCIEKSVQALTGTPAESAVIQTDQEESRELTRLFVERFEQSVPEGTNGLPSAGESDTASTRSESGSKPDSLNTSGAGNPTTQQEGEEKRAMASEKGISPETRKKILDLADQALTSQQSACESLAVGKIPESLPDQRRSHDLLVEIRKLLPRNTAATEQEREEQSEEQQPQPSPSSEQQTSTATPEPQSEMSTTNEQASVAEPKEEKKRELSEEELRDLLQKILEREKAHETEKRERNRRIPMSPRERDW